MATAQHAYAEAPAKSPAAKKLKFRPTPAAAEPDENALAAIKEGLKQMTKQTPVPPWLMQGVQGGALKASPASVQNALQWLKANG